MSIPRSEFPRPQMVREDWLTLNGPWQFEIDSGKSGEERGLMNAPSLSGEIIVPFCPESDLSGVGRKDFMECVWYRREIQVPSAWQTGRVILHVDACDYESTVWVNGRLAGAHRGGYTPFAFDITDLLDNGHGAVVIRALDGLRSHTQPGGKQSTRYHSYGCSYTRTTGIWQSVWLERVPCAHIESLRYTPDVKAGRVLVEAVCAGASGLTLTAEASFDDRPMGDAQAVVQGNLAHLVIDLNETHLWEAGCGRLYDLKLTLGDDRVDSYFGLRSIEYTGGKLLLNGKPVYQRLILDQGFYPDGIYTAPTDDDLAADITRSMAMGFNGARLHQKIFEPRFLYHADRLGYLVWGEHANWCLDISRPEAWRGFLPEWLEAIRRDYNHPSIIGWCPLNETQKDQDPWFVKMLMDMTRSWDATRPLVDASGWYHTGDGDVVDIHCYEQDPAAFQKVIDAMARGEAVKTHSDQASVATFVSEFGGTWWSQGEAGWGYGQSPLSEEEFLTRFKGLVDACLDAPGLCAFCYTQLTDVEQEQNGLYTYDRRAKFPPEVIRAIVARKAAIEE